MTDEEIRAVVIDEIRRLTPETDPTEISADADIRDALDFDSMDVLNLVIGLGKRLGIEVPEADYPKLTSINGAVAYLSAKGEGLAGAGKGTASGPLLAK